MIHVGPQPILWHIMKIYSYYGINDFIICCGYRGDLIKKYFAEYALSNSDVSFDLRTGEMVTHQSTAEPWKVTLVDTGANSMTWGSFKAGSVLCWRFDILYDLRRRGVRCGD